MAMTNNIRTTMNTVSKLFHITDETHKRMAAMQTAKTVQESIEAAKNMAGYSKRVDRLCKKLGIDREAVDNIYVLSEGSEDMFTLHLLSVNEMGVAIYNTVITSVDDEADEAEEDTETATVAD